jgi:hypothetical protein
MSWPGSNKKGGSFLYWRTWENGGGLTGESPSGKNVPMFWVQEDSGVAGAEEKRGPCGMSKMYSSGCQRKEDGGGFSKQSGIISFTGKNGLSGCCKNTQEQCV